MNLFTIQPTGVKPVDPDLAEQAVPGHGVPSQDPTPAAQVALNPEEAERESNSALIGGGVVAGSAAGAAIGAAVAGPVGILVGGAAGQLVTPEGKGSADDAPKDAADIKDRIPPR